MNLCYLFCLCCNRKVELNSPQEVASSEHLCTECKKLSSKEYQLVLSFGSLRKEVTNR